jgi:hypothetical protein
MGSMSASDAAPLPRLGEVFFDVRGSSRSMRLSWYADTGVAVFSIWQGGMCTGTFRLAIADLPRMIDTLQRGPAGQDPGAPGEAFGDVPMGADARMQDLGRPPGGEFGEYQGEYQEDYRRGPAEYPADRPGALAGTAYYPADRPDPLAGTAHYPADRPDPLTSSVHYPADRPDRLTSTAQYPADRPDPLTGPAPDPGRAPDYPAEPGRHQGGPAGPPDPWSGPGDSRHSGASYPPRRPDASYPGPGPDASYPAPRPDASFPGAGPDGSYPPRRPEASYPGPRPEAPYPADRPEAPYPGRPERPDPSYPGALPEASYPPGSDPLYPGPTAGGQRSRRAADQGARPGIPDDPYLGGAGRSPADYDYPTQYGAPDDEEIAPGPPPESFPYGRPLGNRGPGGRHADPDAPFD